MANKPQAAKNPPRAAKPRGFQDDTVNGIESPQPFLAAQLSNSATPSGRSARKASMSPEEVSARVREFNLEPTVSEAQLHEAVNRIGDAAVRIDSLPEEIRETVATMKPSIRSFHGAKMSLAWFPLPALASPCANKFGYMSSQMTRKTTRLRFTRANKALLDTLGDLMADAGRETSPVSVIPAGFTYVGQFVDHDITLDVSSSLEAATDAETIHNMRTPALDLDSLYGDGPALHPFLYIFPSSGPSTAIRFAIGTNRNAGAGGPAGDAGDENGMQVQTDFDVPRVHNPLDPAGSSNTAIIGDPRNDENLIVTQFHHAMLRFHNRVVDLLVAANFAGDIFIEAKRLVTHHYQWAVVHDFLARICGSATLKNAFDNVNAPINSPFSMPVEFAVAAYRFGHSMVRDDYWISFRFPNASMEQVFRFARNPNLPVLSNWVVDFNAFFDTGVPVPVNNKARRIDSVLASELENLPNFTGIMKVLARRNLQRGLALGLPSGQGMAKHFRLKPMPSSQITQGLPANELAVLNANSQMLLKKTPLWYYVLREAAVLGGGDRLGPVGGRIVAQTFVRMLKRDGNSFLNVNGGFMPILPSKASGTFTFADLLIFAGVTQP